MVTNVNDFKDFDGDLYISGGASVYKLFMTGSAKLMPDIVVDCMYRGEVNSALEGAKIDISPCVEVLKRIIEAIEKEDEQ